MSLKKVVACLKRNKKFLITSHTSLEGDALGAQLAFSGLLRRLGKEAIMVNEDALPYGYSFLPGINQIRKFKGSKKNMSGIKFDCFAAVDCSDLSRCGEVSKLNAADKTLLNIDHHISNTYFGDINWVEPQASSASEMIYKLYKKLRIPLDKETATLLYVGILADTGSFRYSNTTAFTHQAAAELLKYNLDVVQIYRQVYENIPFPDMKLLSSILIVLRRDAEGKIAWFKVKRSLLKSRKVSVDVTEHVLSFARAIKDVEVAVLFKENLRKNEVRVNFRSQGKVDVNKIAQYFGGGGHRAASGCTIAGNIDQVARRVLRKIKENL